MGQLGADVHALDRLSKQFHTQSASLQKAATDITSLVTSAWWHGNDQAAFSSQWTSTHKPSLTRVGTTLEQLSVAIKTQAEQQRTASSSAGWVTVDPGGGPNGPGTGDPGSTDAPRSDADVVLELGQMQDAPKATQAEWWKGLTDDQRKMLIAEHPDRVYSLKGIPEADLAAAKEGFLKSFRGSVPKYQVTQKIKGEFDIKAFEAEVGAHARVIENLDGSYTVEFRVEGDIAAKFGAEGNATLRYEFENKEDAEQFRDGFYEIFTDGWKDMKGFNAPKDAYDNLGKAKDLIPDAYKYLAESDNLVSSKIEGGVKADIELKAGNEDKSGLSAEAEVGAGGWKDLKTGDWGFYLNGEVSGRAGLDADNAVSGKAKLRIDVQFNDDGELTKVKVGGELGGDIKLLDIPGLNTQQGNLKFLAELDVSDPNTEAAIKKLTSGELSIDEFTELIDQGQVIVYGSAGGGSTVKPGPIDVDWGPLEITSETTVDVTGPVWVHPAGGDWELLDR